MPMRCRSGACFLAQTGNTASAGVTGSFSSAKSAGTAFKTVMKPIASTQMTRPLSTQSKPQLKGLHDPSAPEAVLLNAEQWKAGSQSGGSPVVPVVVDPYLARHLRPHQKEGVQFMYECIMGLRHKDYTGCVLSDEMGLG